MRKFTSALLFGAYVLLALTVAALLWRGGADWGAAVAGFCGALGATLAAHAVVSQALTRAAIDREIETVREAHRLLVDAIEATQNAVDDLTARFEGGEVGGASSSELTREVRMLEDLVVRMGETLESKLAGLRGPIPIDNPTEHRRDRQAAALLETVREALADNRVDLYLQPVVGLPQRRTVFYESFSRLRDASGRVIMPAEYLSVAEPAGMVSAIDNLLLFRCVQIVRRLAKQDRKVGIFCNVSLASLGDEVFFPQFLEFLAENRDLSGALIFELGQEAFESRGPVEARNMAKLADLGFKFSLDKVTSFDLDLIDLQRADVKFVKVAAGLLLSELLEGDGSSLPGQFRDIHSADVAPLFRRYGVELVAEKVESERQVVDVLELDLAYGQGHLFGEPRAIKEAVLAETAPPADFVRSSLQLSRRARAAG